MDHPAFQQFPTIVEHSALHINKNSNEEIIHVRNFQELPESAQKKECRICLEGEEEGRIMKPCICQGSVSYTHEVCLSEWIKRKQDKNRKIKVCCEMCNFPFKYKIAKNRHFSCQEFLTNYEKNKTNYNIFFVTLGVVFLVIVGLIILLSFSSQNNEVGKVIQSSVIKNEDVKIIYICAVFLVSVVFMFMIVLFLIESAVQGEYVIVELKNYNEPMESSSKRVHPYGK